MLYVLLAILISAGISAVMLLITRQRLARQFEDIQRRLINNERSLIAIENLKSELQNTSDQLLRVHQGLTRMQENVAHRFEELAPRGRAVLTEFQLEMLRQWAKSLPGAFDSARIEDLAGVVGRAEAMELRDVELGTVDLLALLVAVLGHPGDELTAAAVGPFATHLEPILRRVGAAYAKSIEIADGSSPGGWDVLILDATISPGEVGRTIGLMKAGSLLVCQGASGPDESEPANLDFGFELVAAEWNTRVYRKSVAA